MTSKENYKVILEMKSCKIKNYTKIKYEILSSENKFN